MSWTKGVKDIDQIFILYKVSEDFSYTIHRKKQESKFKIDLSEKSFERYWR